MIFGVSVFPSELDLAGDTLTRAAQAGAKYVFTSLHIPEDDPAVLLDQTQLIAELVQEVGMELIADVSPNLPAVFGVEPWQKLRTLGISRVRLDFGFSAKAIAQIAQFMPISVNASATDPAELSNALAANPSPTKTLALHNYYPRRWTGLSTTTVAHSARSWHNYGFELGGFISGDDVRRGPLGEGLPTIEDSRDLDPLAQLLMLVETGCDFVFVGDPKLGDAAWHRIGCFLTEGLIEVPVILTPGLPTGLIDALQVVDHNRFDAAAYLVRLADSRSRLTNLDLPLIGGQQRPRGTVTVDLDRAGRYRGEITITKCDLPPDPKVAVVGHLPQSSVGLVDLIGPACPLRLQPFN